MARWSKWFDPIRLPPDEVVIFRKRESLRLQGPAWALFAMLVVGLAVAWASLAVALSGLQAVLQSLLSALLILLAIGALPATILLLLIWAGRSYILTSTHILPSDDLAARFLAWGSERGAGSAQAGLLLAEVTRAQARPARSPAAWFDIGDVILSTATQASALTLTYVDHPNVVASQLLERAEAARSLASGRLPEGRPKRIRRSIAWLLRYVAPAAVLLWATVASWLTLRLLTVAPPATIRLALSAGVVVAALTAGWWLISVLRWWYRVWVVTERRVIAREGLLTVIRRDLALDDVMSATVIKAGILQRLLDVGHVQVITAGLSGDVVMRNVSAPDSLRQAILETQLRLRQSQQQLEIEDISRRLKQSLVWR
jgi:hypothetical protein